MTFHNCKNCSVGALSHMFVDDAAVSICVDHGSLLQRSDVTLRALM